MITSTLEVPLRLCVMGDPCWNSTSGVPTWVTHDAKPQRHSITEAFQIVTPGLPKNKPWATVQELWGILKNNLGTFLYRHELLFGRWASIQNRYLPFPTIICTFQCM